MLTDPETLLATYAYGIVAQNPHYLSLNLHHMVKLHSCFTDWHIKINTTKIFYVASDLRRQPCPTVFLSGSPIPQSGRVRNLGL